MVSKREQDLARRRGTQAPKSPQIRNTLIIIGVTVAAIAIIAALNQDSPETKAENMAAFSLHDDPYQGSLDAPVVLAGFESPWCSACQAFHQQVLPKLQPLIDDGSLLYIYSQHTWGHQDDLQTSGAQECAFSRGGNDAFWSFTDGVYAIENFYGTSRNEEARLRSVAADETEADAMVQCFREGSEESAVRNDWRVARDHGLSGTPRFALFGLQGEAQYPNLNEVEQKILDEVEKWT